GDDFPRGIDRHTGGERRETLEALPAIIEGDARLGLVAPGCIRQRPAATPAIAVDRGTKIARRPLARDRRASKGGRARHGWNPSAGERTKQERSGSEAAALRAP